MAGRPCQPYVVDPTKLKYLAVTVMTAASTVLAKSVRFLEHVSLGVLCGYREYRAGILVHVNLYISSFSHNNVQISTHGLSSLCKVCLPCDLPFPRLSLYRRTNRQTDTIVNYSNSRCACARGLISSK